LLRKMVRKKIKTRIKRKIRLSKTPTKKKPKFVNVCPPPPPHVFFCEKFYICIYTEPLYAS